MTSYRVVNGRLVADKLPDDFGPRQALRGHPDLQAWARAMFGKYVYCPRCHVAIPSARLDAHMAAVHPPKDGASGQHPATL